MICINLTSSRKHGARSNIGVLLLTPDLEAKVLLHHMIFTILEDTHSVKENTLVISISKKIYFKKLKRFNIKSLTWTLLYGGKDITPRVDHSLVIENKNLYIFGGSDGKNKFDDLYRYEI
jgi:hypothetical protein